MSVYALVHYTTIVLGKVQAAKQMRALKLAS